MILLQANNIARYFGADILFENIQLEISDMSRIALVGRNGAGKSTLLKIIASVEKPDMGKISKSKQVTIGYLAQNTGLDSEDTVYNEMLKAFDEVRRMECRMREVEAEISILNENSREYARLSEEYDQLHHDFSVKNGYAYETETRSVLHGFHFDESFYDKRIADLSGGQKTRLALAKHLLQKPDLLILDEPTNHLDIETLAWLENYLQNYRGAILIVSHDRYFLDKVANETYELSRQKLRYYKGNYSKYLELKAQELANEQKQYEKQQAEIGKLEDFVARNLVRASTTKRAQSRRKQLEKMERLEKPIGGEKSVHFGFQIDKTSGNMVLQLKSAAIGYEEVLSEPIDLDIRRKDAVALVGPNGIGKSTLLKSIVGKLDLLKGETVLGTNVEVGYYDQEQAELHGTKTVLAELWDEHPTLPEKEVRNVLGGFLFSGDDVEKTIPLLSGGEKARVALAKLSMNHENFLILDEPTNHLDIDNKEVLENALIDYEGTLLFVSHDRYFINRIATKVIELSENGSKLYLGDYDYYLEKKTEEEQIKALKEPNVKKVEVVTQEQQNFREAKERQKKERALKRKVESLENDLLQIEQLIENLHKAMELASNENNALKLNELNTEYEVSLAKQETLLDDWEVASLALEE